MIAVPEGHAAQDPVTVLRAVIDETIEVQYGLDALEKELAAIGRRIGAVKAHGIRADRGARAALGELRWRQIKGRAA